MKWERGRWSVLRGSSVLKRSPTKFHKIVLEIMSSTMGRSSNLVGGLLRV